MNKPLRRFGIFLSLLVPLAGFAQAPSPPSPQYAEEIEVRVIDVDVVVTDRHGNPLASLTRAAVATEANPLGVAIRADRPKVDGWGRDHLLAFDFSLQLDKLTFVKRGGTQRADFVMHFSLVGRDGAVDPLESREQALAIPQSELPADPDQLVSYSWHVDLSPLRIPETVPAKQDGLRLIVSVEDLTSGVRSVLTVPLGNDQASRR